MIFEISNPSDAYTMQSDDPAAACVACWFLGGGHYGLKDEGGNNACPIMIMGGDPNKTLLSLYQIALDDLMKIPERKAEVIRALRSVLIGNIQDRRDFESAVSLMSPENAEKFAAKRHDERRTSLTDIGKRAMQLAEAIK